MNTGQARRWRENREARWDMEDYTKDWRRKDAATYAKVLVSHFGKPKIIGPDMLAWDDKAGFTKVWVIDESVAHDFPVPHKDFVYSTRTIKVPPALVGKLAAVTGSIMVDGLKREVTARCGMLIKNAVTLGFVEDVVRGKIKTGLKAEYARRIKGDSTPPWFANKPKER